MFYFTSDLHFSHANIIKYCNRPWATTQEMDEGLIKNFNSIITPQDTLFMLGDFAMNNQYDRIEPLIKRMNGKKVFLLGNHDNRKTFRLLQENKLIAEYHDTLMMKHNDQAIFMSHYPHLVWNMSGHGSYHLYGHVHGKFANDILKNGLSMDVGVDCNDYMPVSFDQVNEHMKKIKAMKKKIDDDFGATTITTI